MNLKDEIRKLVQLQEIDTQIYNLREEKDVNKPRELEEIKRELEQSKQSFSISEEKVKELQLKRKNKELDLASKEENLKKAQAQLYQLKTNKEYQAKLTEIGSLKADISIVEDNVIKILDEIESAQKIFNQQKELLNQKEKEFKETDNRIKSQIKDIEAKIKNLEDKRNNFIKEIDHTVLSKYEKLLKSRHGLALVPVKNNNCGACHMIVTPQKINEIKMYNNLIFCESCVRILYIPEDIL